MTCTTCGGEQATDRHDHLCDRDVQPTGFRRPNPPSWGWRALTLGVLGVAAVYLGASILNLVVKLQDYWLVTGFQADPNSVSVSEIVARMERSGSVGTLAWLALLAHLGTYLVWLRATRRAVEGYGGDRRTTLRHWTFTTWQISIAAIFLLTILMRNDGTTDVSDADRAIDEALDFERFAILVAALRLPLVGLLVAGVLIVARRVYQLAGSQPPPPAPYFPSAVEPGALPRTAVQDGPGQDAFWNDVAHAVARSAGPLALLESWAPAASARRWHLLHDEAGIAAVRTRLAPWSGITVYGQPPRTPDEALLGQFAEEARWLREDRIAGGAIGLIEAEGGKLRFEQLTSDAVLRQWLGQARSASLAGVYPVLAAFDSAALTSG